MKHTIIIVLLGLCGLQASAQTEEQAFLKAVYDYLDGGTNGNAEQFKGAFVPDAVQRSIGKNGSVIGMSVESLASKLTPGQVMNRQTRIVSWSYSGIAGTAVTETIYPSSKIIDYLNLLNVNGQWKITTRVYSRIESDEEIVSSTNSGSSSASKTSTAKAPAPAAKKKVVIDDGW